MQTVAKILEKLASFDGVQGCALVEADTGMVWHHAGQQLDMESVGEAAVEFWRTQNRVSGRLSMMGVPKFASFNYAKCVISLIPCDEELGLILVCVAVSPGMVWSDWLRELPTLRSAVRAMKSKVNLAS